MDPFGVCGIFLCGSWKDNVETTTIGLYCRKVVTLVPFLTFDHILSYSLHKCESDPDDLFQLSVGVLGKNQT